MVGTAGHIDHGKTRLIEALTGIDADRLAEEKARGITIDLGFAHFSEAGAQIGFIDVPGHEKFLHNALVGLGGIRLVLLVVAADEGVMPQTREHLAICRLLGLRHAVVALTKIDRVDDDARELAALEVEELLAPTPFAGAPILPVSSTRGDGVAELRALLVSLARQLAFKVEPSKPARLPIDRAFQLRGLGVVVTGSLLSGRVEAGRTLEALPLGRPVKARGLQVHGAERQQADAGERLAIQLAGVEPGELQRGDVLVDPGIYAAQRTLAVRLELLEDAPPLEHTVEVVVFHLTAETLGRLRPLSGPIAPGGSGLAELRLRGRLVAIRGDRLIVRRPSPAATIGGGEILDPAWRRRRGPLLAPALARVAGDETAALELWVGERGERGIAAEELSARLGRKPEAIKALLDPAAAAGKLVAVDLPRGRRYLDPRAVQRVFDKARAALKAYFAEDRLARGMPRAQLLSQILGKRAHDLGASYLAMLQAQRILVVDGELVNQPGRSAKAALSQDESSLAARVLEMMERGGLQPPGPGEVTAVLGAKQQIVEGIQKFLIGQGKLRRLPDGLIFSTAALDKLAADLRATDWDRFSVPRFKDHFGLSRKWAIPLLEYLDAGGVTRRHGDERQVLRRT